MSQRAGIVWTGARGRHHNWGMTPPWKAYTFRPQLVTQHSKAVQSWLNVSYQWHSWLHIPSHGYPFATFLLIVPALYNLPSEPYLAFSHVYSIYGGVDTFRLSFPMLLGQLASSSVQPVGDRRWEEGKSWGISFPLFLPWATSPPLTCGSTREAHLGSSFCVAMSSNITASPCSLACR